MNYEDRFKNNYHRVKVFNSEPLMLSFINENCTNIAIAQVYTTSTSNSIRFHLLYKLQESEESNKEKVVI